jgi:hypothetical protein
MMMTAVLLVVALTASAQGATKGTVKSSDKQMEMAYYFEGGKVTKQSSSAGRISYTYEVEEGATLKFYCKKVKGTDELRIVIDGKEAKGQSSASMTYQVPKGINRFSVWLEGTADYDLASAIDEDDGEISVGIECIVKNGSSSGSSTNSSSSLSSYKGTISYLDTKMEYSLSGAIVTRKKVTDEGYSSNVMQVEIMGQTEAGSTVSAAYKKIAGCVKEKAGANVSITAYTSDGKTISLQNKSGNGSSTASGKVPDKAKTIKIFMSYQNINLRQINCSVTLEVMKKADANKNKLFNWNDESIANHCEYCKGQISNYSINSTSFNAYVCCNNHRSEQKKYARKIHDWFDFIYYNDLIWTDGSGPIDIFNKCGDVTITIMENSLIHLKKRTSDGKDIWVLEKGNIVGQGLKRTDCEFEMTYCTAKPTGTTYVLENDGKSSRVYLLQGSMEVTSKKGSKKSTLKPGQAATVNNQGQMSVNSFDVGAMAKKYKISGVSSTTTTTQDKDARYDVKCAVVKYKYTKGKETGQQERSFDNYGKLERRHFKSSSNETLMYIRDNKNYSLNVKKKTMTVTEDEQLNFKNTNDSRIKKTDKRKTATILGKTCTLYQTKSSDYWVWKGIVLKKIERLKDGTQAITEATSIQTLSSLPASTFEVPKGYKKK